MTTPERELLQAFLVDFLQPAIEGIREDMTKGFESVNQRLTSLETTRTEERAIRQDRRARDERTRSELRWRIATAFSAGGLAASFLYYIGLLHHL